MTDPKLTPPPELVEQWIEETRSRDCIGAYPADLEECVATRAAQWGADQELEACCEWTAANFGELPGQNLHLYRRPKPQSLKEQALQELNLTEDLEGAELSRTQVDLIRRALEALPE